MGMAFQVADDILDYVGSEAETGKPAGQDLREQKVTLPLIGALAAASPGVEGEIREFFNGAESSEEDISRLIEIVRGLGGVEYAKKKAQEFAVQAEEALVGLPAGPAVDALRESITYVVDRNR